MWASVLPRLEGLINHAHLRAVAVSDHHLVTKGDKIDDRPGGVLYGPHLSGEIVAQRIPAESENNFLLIASSHYVSVPLTVW